MTRWASMGQYNRPDWVMLGTPDPKGGVFVWASDKLSYSELTAVYHTYREVDPSFTHIRHGPTGTKSYTLKVELGDIVVGAGRDYPEALQHLMSFWSPKPRAEYEQPALGEGQREIGPPR